MLSAMSMDFSFRKGNVLSKEQKGMSRNVLNSEQKDMSRNVLNREWSHLY